MNTRAVTSLAFLLAALLLLVCLVWLALNFALPQPEWVEIGRLADFPPSDEPYPVVEGVSVYVVNAGQELIVLDPLNQVPGGAVVRWQPLERAFIDPSRGSLFDLHGMPVRRLGIHSILEKQSLPRYPMKVEDGRVLIELKAAQVEKVPEIGQP